MTYPKEFQTQSARLQRPRSLRIPAHLPLELEGETLSGEPFQITVPTIKLSYRGATVAADLDVADGSPVRIRQPFWGTLEAQVNGVWVNEEDGQRQIGLKIIHPHGWFAE